MDVYFFCACLYNEYVSFLFLFCCLLSVTSAVTMQMSTLQDILYTYGDKDYSHKHVHTNTVVKRDTVASHLNTTYSLQLDSPIGLLN